jgi:hypothetical protein
MHNFAFGIYFVVDLVSSNEFDTTVTELKAIASAASIGKNSYTLMVNMGISAPAAIGISIML